MDISLTTVDKIKLNKIALKQLKQLSRTATCEQLKLFTGDEIVLAKHNGKIIGMCNIAMLSPQVHFTNEEGHEIPYLYNYMCDLTHHKKKPSVHIMNFIKNLISTGDYEKEINLDVLVDNIHAQNFFKKNNFVAAGEYKQGVKEYIMFTFAG